MLKNRKMPQPSVIAIDGPTASGKTAVGKALARRLAYRFVDTGDMYRATTWLALEQGIGFDDEAALSLLAEESDIQILPDSEGGAVRVNGRDITTALRSPEVEAAVSLVSRVEGVRQALVAKQRHLADGGALVMAGRDIGTVVLRKEAGLKVYLTASAVVRARRRLGDMAAQGRTASYEEVLEALQRRDRLDSQRAISPLRPAEDAHIIETDNLDIDGVLAAIQGLFEA